MATTAFGVRQDTNGNGTSDLVMRKINQYHWHNTGVVAGLGTGGRSDLRYAVQEGFAICSMGNADGYSEAYWPGGFTENAVQAGDNTYPRIDTIYMLSNTGTPDNLVHVMVAQGTPSASPVRPHLPVGALPLMDMRFPAGGSNTAAAVKVTNDISYAIPYGSSLGRIGYGGNTTTVWQEWKPQRYTQVSADFYLPTDRLVECLFTFRAWTGDVNKRSSFYVGVYDNGNPIGAGTGVGDEASPSQEFAVRQTLIWDFPLSAGSHRLEIRIQPNTNANSSQFQWYGNREIQVFDRGVSQ